MSDRQQTLRLFFIVNDKTAAQRNWIVAPRVGDLVRIGSKIYRATEVLWGMAVDDDTRSDPTLHISLEKTDRVAG